LFLKESSIYVLLQYYPDLAWVLSIGKLVEIHIQPAFHSFQNATLGVAFSEEPEFATCDVANLRKRIETTRSKRLLPLGCMGEKLVIGIG